MLVGKGIDGHGGGGRERSGMDASGTEVVTGLVVLYEGTADVVMLTELPEVVALLLW